MSPDTHVSSQLPLTISHADLFNPDYRHSRHPGIFEYPGIVPLDELSHVNSGTTPVIVEQNGLFGFHWTPQPVYGNKPHTALYCVSQGGSADLPKSRVIIPDSLGRVHGVQSEDNLTVRPLEPLTIFEQHGRHLFVYADGDKLSVCFTPKTDGLASNWHLLRGLDTVVARFNCARNALSPNMKTEIDISFKQMQDLTKAFSDRNLAGCSNGNTF